MRHPSLWLRRARMQGDSGVAMVTVMTIAALMTTMAFVAITVAATNYTTSGSDRLAASAMTVSEAGVAQAVAYVRANGVADLRCAPDCGTTNAWGEAGDDGDSAPPQRVTVSSNESYDVWFKTLIPMNGAGKQAGVYRVVSVGTSNPGPGSRRVEVDIEVAPFGFPLGVFADTVDGGGDPGLHHMSLFATRCISGRDSIEFSGANDLVYNRPPAAHSAQFITTGNACGSTDSGNIHKTATCPPTWAYRYDEDSLDSSCYTTYAGAPPFTTARITSAHEMGLKYDFNVNAFTDAELEMLKQVAIQQGLYFRDDVAIPAALRAGGTAPWAQPVLFYDLEGAAVGKQVDLKDLDNPAFLRTGIEQLAVTDTRCTGRSAIVVVKNGNVRLNSNTQLNAYVFALGPEPHGQVSKANGTAQLFGTLYGKHVDMRGTADMRMDQCVLESMSGALLSVNVKNFREVDSP
jgi:hypothetical protein